jgi:putative heme-binding domain-containing protein
LFTGWSTRDTHAGPSNLQYGLDNWIYGIVGYAGFEGQIGGERRSFRTGFYRLRIDRKEELAVRFEFLRNTNNNSWGVGISEEGLVFGSTANGNPSVYLPIPNRYYEAVRGWSSTVLGGIAGNARMEPITDRIRQVDFHGRFTAASGHALYTARTYPKAYWNRAAFVSEPTGHLTATFVLERDGADFRSRNAWNLLAGDDEWVAPIMAEVGPDGHVWIIDWYNYIVQHNPTPVGFRTGKGNAYETELRDKKHGRIYRLVHKQARPAPAPSLQGVSPEKLVATLKHDNMFWRKHAQRLLVERGKTDMVPALIELAGDTTVDEIELNPAVMHALWTLHGLGALDGAEANATAAAVKGLRHKSAGVRRSAVAVLPRKPESLRALLDSGLLEDPDAQVRLATFLALAELPPSPEAAAAIVRQLSRTENLQDRWLPDALTSAAAAHAFPFLTAVAAAKSTLPAKALEIVAIVAEHHARGGQVETVGPLLIVLTEADSKVAETILNGLARGWPRNRPVALDEAGEKAMARLFARLTPAAKARLVQLAQGWGGKGFDKLTEEILAVLSATAVDAKQPDEQRIHAARQWVELRPDDARIVNRLLDLVTPRIAPQLAAGLLDAAGQSSAPEVGKALIARCDGWPPATRAVALRLLLSRAEWTRELLKALDGGRVPLSELTLDQKQALAAHPDAGIADTARRLLARGGGLPSPDRQKVLDELLPLAERKGDVGLGKAVFLKHCASCHRHGVEGHQVGPDLTGMAVHTRAELLAQIIDPNRSVEGNYRSYTVLTRDGRILAGLLASETRTSIELVDAQAKRHVLQRDNLDEMLVTNKSVMPEGFEKQMLAEELVHLLEFLTQRGKYLPIPLDRAATIVSTRGMFHREDSTAERLILDDWKPRTFAGVPFVLVDPQGDRVANVILLHGPQGTTPPRMPRSVTLPCNAPARAIHLLSGVSGWGHPLGEKGSVSLIVRLHYADGKTEEHPLRNGEHFADYIRRVDVPGSQFAFALRSQQIRYLSIQPQRSETIRNIEFVKGSDRTAPIIMAVTVEGRDP